MIYARASLRHRPDHNQNVVCTMTWAVRRSLNAESFRQAEVAVEDIGTFMKMPQGTLLDIQGTYTILKRWYCQSSAQKPTLQWRIWRRSPWTTLYFIRRSTRPIQSGQYQPTSPHSK